MRSTCLVLAAVFAIGLATSGSALAWDHVYDGSVLPDDAQLGATAWGASSWKNDVSSCAVEGGALRILDASPSTTAYYSKSAIPAGSAVTIEARMQVVSGSGTVLSAGTPSGGTWVWFDTNRVTVRFGGGTTIDRNVDMLPFRTVRIANDRNGDSSVWLDSTLIANGNALTSNGGALQFGAGLVAAVSESRWDYVAYSAGFIPIPEPSSGLALGVGGFGLLGTALRRRIRARE